MSDRKVVATAGSIGQTPPVPVRSDPVVHTSAAGGWFGSEAEMLWPLARDADTLLGRRRAADGPFEVFFEVPAAAGVPDLLVVRFDVATVAARERLGGNPVVRVGQARVLCSLLGRRLDPGQIAVRAGLTVSHVRHTLLPELAEAGVAVRDTDRLWTAALGVAPVVDTVVAVEAKRRDWKRALKQARRYAGFANSVFMALDERGAAVALQHADEIVGMGVGVATVAAKDGRVRIRRRPRWRRPRVDWESFLVGERLWELARQDRRSGPSFDVFGRTPAPTPDRLSAAQVDLTFSSVAS